MFAGIWAAYKGLSPLVKYGAIAALVGVLWLSWLGYKEYLRYQGRQQAKAEEEVRLRVQQQESTRQYIEQIGIQRKHITELEVKGKSQDDRLSAAQKVIDEYKKSKTPIVDARAVRIVDDLARVRDPSPTERSGPTSGTTTGTSIQKEATTCPVDVGVLLQRVKDYAGLLADAEDGHEALSNYVVDKYKAELEFYNNGQGR